MLGCDPVHLFDGVFERVRKHISRILKRFLYYFASCGGRKLTFDLFRDGIYEGLIRGHEDAGGVGIMLCLCKDVRRDKARICA